MQKNMRKIIKKFIPINIRQIILLYFRHGNLLKELKKALKSSKHPIVFLVGTPEHGNLGIISLLQQFKVFFIRIFPK